jgi:signal transduction histidine kinase/CheY-like chemotaxis protein
MAKVRTPGKKSKAKSKTKPAPAKAPRKAGAAAAKATAPNADSLLEALSTSPIGAAISRVSDGVILYANAAIGMFFRLPPGRAVGLSTADFFVNPQDRDHLIELVRANGGVTRHSLSLRTSEGKPRLSFITNRLIQFRGEPAILTWVEDQSEIQHKEDTVEFTARQVELVNRIAAIANRAVNFYDALRQGSAEIGTFLGWPIRLVYRLAHGEKERLEIATFALAKDLFADQSVKSAVLGKSFSRGEDLPGSVLATGASIWIEDVTNVPSLTRFSKTANIIGSVLAIPIKADDQVVAVLEFMKQIPAAADDLLKLTFERVGSELGRVYLRDQITVALQEARAEAESSTRAKASFLAAMSHEVRTPMNGVVGMVDLVLQTKLDDDQRSMLQTVKDSGHALIKVINDILDFSKIDAGRLEIESNDMSVTKIVEDVAVSLSPSAIQKGIKFITSVDPTIPETVKGDAVRVRQILSNLVGNAVKFSSQGEIVISARRQEGSRGEVHFSVRDQGIGIAPAARRRLFEEFSQADSSTTRRFGGTGLGLAISQRLTTLMGGEIGVESILGESSNFHFTLPFGHSDAKTAARTHTLEGLNVLIAAGSEPLREAASAYLEHWSATTSQVTDIDECIAASRAAQTIGKPFDVIVIPEVDDHAGIAAVRGRFPPPFPRFVIGRDPAHPADALRKLAEVTLVDVNPMRRSSLIAAVAVAAGRASPEVRHVEQPDASLAVAPPTVEEAMAQGRLILVAEDHPANREVLRRQLNKLGFACEIADDGQQALEMWRNRSYGLVLTDCHMPAMDGFGLTAAIRKSEENSGRRTPIIAITANVLQGEAERCLAAGMDDFLPKPVELKVMKGVFDKWLNGAAPAKAAGEAAAGVAAGTPIILDLANMRETFGAINEDARDMLRFFVNTIAPLVTRYNDEMERSDIPAAFETIHKARGAVANCGGRELAAIMGDVEVALAAQNVDTARARSQEIDPAWQRLVKAINEV